MQINEIYEENHVFERNLKIVLKKQKQIGVGGGKSITMKLEKLNEFCSNNILLEGDFIVAWIALRIQEGGELHNVIEEQRRTLVWSSSSPDTPGLENILRQSSLLQI